MEKNNHTKRTVENGQQGTLGTFAGVFTPSILTILGIILFLRLGFVVGSAGLARALIIIALANAISVLTTFSLSAIATNLKVKGGGDYYLISRTLGMEFGGSIGIVLFLAQSVSIAFYCIGFGEAVATIVPNDGGYHPQVIAALAVAFLFVLAWLGTDWATRFQYVVMAILIAALGSFFIGGIQGWDGTVVVQNWQQPSDPLPFWVIFAIFFPAVTGFTQGVSMSGDLKDPGKSLPLGTFIAVGLSIVVYVVVAVVFAGNLPQDILVNDYGAMSRVSAVGALIYAGVIAATLSSAMASFLGAPRILQSMAGDRIFPVLVPFAKGAGETNNPRRAVLLSAAIALATIGLGNLNVIAPVVSMFFLISYGLLNYATYYEARTDSPSFRPRFHWYHKRISLFGGTACLCVMLAIDLTAGIIAIAVLTALYQYLKRTAGPARWADSRRSYHLQHLREHLIAAASEPEHPRDWRPQTLAFSDNVHRRGWLLRFASWIEGGSGFTTAVRLLQGEGARMIKLREEAEKELRADITAQGVQAFPLVVVAHDAHYAVQTLIQSFGIGPLQVNTVLLNWIEQREQGFLGLRELRMGKNLRTSFRLGCNIILLDVDEKEWDRLRVLPAAERRIDVWWWNDPSSHLMLLLAYLITRNEEWKGSKIRVLAPRQSGTSDQPTPEELQQLLEEVRIEAESMVVMSPTLSMIQDYSSDAALVLLPFRLRGSEVCGPLDEKIDELVSRLPITALTLAAEDIDLDADPEVGPAAETAAAVDAYEDAVKIAEETQKEAAEAAEKAEEMLDKMKQAVESGLEDEDLKKAQEASFEAEVEAKSASRKAAKAAAKASEAAKAAEELGGSTEVKDK